MSQSRIRILARKIVPEQIHYLVHGNTIRVPRYWRLQKNVCVKTIDTDFEETIEELDAIEEACKEIAEILKIYCSVSSELISSSLRVVNSFHILTHTCFTNTDDAPQEIGSSAWTSAKSYQIALEAVNITLRETLCEIPQELDSKIGRLVDTINHIHKQVNTRDKLLAQYESMKDKYDSLTLLQATKNLSSRRKREHFDLKTAMEVVLKEYTDCNSMICLELPYFFELVRQFIQPFLELLFFIQLSVTYQTYLNFVPLMEDLGIDDEVETSSFLKDHLDTFSYPDSLELKNLDIIQLHKNYLELLIHDTLSQTQRENLPETCEALYDYKSDVPEDLVFSRGDVIQVLLKSGNWWEGQTLNGRGMFPRNYVTTTAEKFVSRLENAQQIVAPVDEVLENDGVSQKDELTIECPTTQVSVQIKSTTNSTGSRILELA